MSIVKSFSVGNGDMFYIDHNSDNFTTIDCCYENEDDRDINFNEMKSLASKKGITRFISTHPDEDHIRGIGKFDEIVGIYNFYCVDNDAKKTDETDNFKKYKELRISDKKYYVSKGCQRKWMNISDKERKCSGINFLWPVLDNKDFKEVLEEVKEGSGFNNISPVFTYSIENGARFMWMGDLEKDFLEKVKDEIDWCEVDVLFAPHHGRDSGKVPEDVLQKINPKIIVVGEAPSKNLNYYNNYNTITQNSAKDIIFNCKSDHIHIYVSNETYADKGVKFLEKLNNKKSSLGYYLGSLKL